MERERAYEWKGRKEERMKKKKLPAVLQSPDLKKEPLSCRARLVSLVGKAGVCFEATRLLVKASKQQW